MGWMSYMRIATVTICYAVWHRVVSPPVGWSRSCKCLNDERPDSCSVIDVGLGQNGLVFMTCLDLDGGPFVPM
jgi:hypothetical protein